MPTFHRLPALLLSTLSLLTAACSQEDCDTDGLPQYTLTADQQAWTASAQPGTIWQFRSAAGKERTYRVDKRDTNMLAAGNGKSSLCPGWYQQEQLVTLSRTDSVDTVPYDLYLKAANTDQQTTSYGFVGSLRWGVTSFSLDQLKQYTIQTVLPSHTVNGRTYPNVLELTGGLSLPNAGSRRVVRLFLDKDYGVIQFEEQGGTVWDRQ